MRGSDAARIALLLHDFAPGGTERIAVRLANHWAAAGRAVTIFAGDASGPARAALDAGVAVVAATPALPRGSRSRARLSRALPAMIAAHPVDVLVAPGNFHLAVLRSAGRLPCAVVAKLSNPLHRPGRGAVAQLVFEASFRAASRHIDILVAMSPVLAAEAQHLVRTPVVTLAEPILAAAPLPRTRGPVPTILCAARMVPQKQLSRALAAVAAGPAGTRLVLLGDGPLRPDLEAQAAALGLGTRACFAGHVPDIAPWLAGADVFLLTSDYEGYPAVLVEAIAAGVPVITTDCSPAIRELVFDPSFGRIQGSDTAALAAAISAVLDGPGIDPRASAELATRHAVGPAATAWLAMLDELVAGRAA